MNQAICYKYVCDMFYAINMELHDKMFHYHLLILYVQQVNDQGLLNGQHVIANNSFVNAF